MTASVALVVRRTIRANVEKIFSAWTEPMQLRAWWGPRPVTCSDAEVDLRVGGRYRIVNALPDGGTLLIEGEFREIEAPRKLVYTWTCGNEGPSLVTVRFEPNETASATDVVIIHENIALEETRKSHEKGWFGCLDGLESMFA